MISFNTEITDNTRNIVRYDAECAFCIAWARRAQRWLNGRGFRFEPLAQQADEMAIVTASGVTLGAADAVVYLARHIWWGWPLWAVNHLPGVMRLTKRAYRWLATKRYCLNGRCEVKPKRSAWPSILLPVAAVAWKPALPAWGFMWAMVAALVVGMIGLTGWRPSVGREQVLPGFCKMTLGAALFWGAARWMPGELACGWVGMIGLVLMLHFGLVHWLMAVCGFESIMRQPLRARSVSEFWGARWNRAFPEMMRPLVFEPVKQMWGAKTATVAVFALSGLLHELVISLPAGAGYGLPTLYFLIQGVGVLTERKMRQSWRRFIACVVIVGPVFWLFHPLFVQRVIIPMMEALGAI